MLERALVEELPVPRLRPKPVCLQQAAECCHPRGSWVQRRGVEAPEAAQLSNAGLPQAYLLRWRRPARQASFQGGHRRPPERRALFVVVLVFAGSRKVREGASPQPETGIVGLAGFGS